MATIRTRKRGKTFSYSFDAGKHPATGRRRIVERGGFSTEQAAYDAGAAAYAAWKAGNIGITSERVPLRDYLAAWVENVARPNVAQGTYGGYVTTIRARIAPYIGGIILQDLRPRMLAVGCLNLPPRAFPVARLQGRGWCSLTL